MKVFISYCRTDNSKSTAEQLYQDLKKNGLEPWMDVFDIKPGQNWKNVIGEAIKSSSYFIALLSSKSLIHSGYFHKELKMASEKLEYTPESKVYLIPVRIDECELKNQTLSELHYVDFFPSYENGLNKIINMILEKKEIFCHSNQGDANKFLENIINENKPKKAYLLEYSADTVQSLIETFGRVGTEVFLLIQNPKIAKQLAGNFQKDKICQRMENILFKTLTDIPNMDITIRCYSEIASMRGRKFGNLINLGWYTYDIRDETLGSKQIWGHSNPLVTFEIDSKEGKIVEESFNKVFTNLWRKGCSLKELCPGCKKPRECIKKAPEKLEKVSSKELNLS